MKNIADPTRLLFPYVLIINRLSLKYSESISSPWKLTVHQVKIFLFLVFLPQPTGFKTKKDINIQKFYCRIVMHACSVACVPVFVIPRTVGYSVHGIFLARILDGVAMPFSRGSSWPKDWICVSCIAGIFFITESLGKPIIVIFVIKFCSNFKTIH